MVKLFNCFILLVVLLFSSFALAKTQLPSFGMTPTEFISNYNITAFTLMGKENAASTIIIDAAYKFGVELDSMTTSVGYWDIKFDIDKTGYIEKIEVSATQFNSDHEITGVSALVALLMLAVNRGYGFEEFKPFADKIKNAVTSKQKSTEIKFKGISYKVLRENNVLKCVITNLPLSVSN